MPIIHELSSHLADLIAAGEVVERPASVAKELIENSIDAGAGHITVEIENGGISYLRIADDGCGMEESDAATAFKRHATSKLRCEEDLSAIGTLGFRGEALAAISSVSRIDLFTKQKGKLAGTHLHIEAGEIQVQEDAGCPDGTTMIIRDLFFNTPARMKFLRKDFTEAGYVLAVVQHAALSHPEIGFTLIRDGKQVFSSAGNGQLKNPVFGVFGREMTESMIEVPFFEKDGLTVRGYITKPHMVRPNRTMQHFFVNGRYIKSRTMQAAMEEAYKNAMITGKYPSGTVFLTMPFSLVDVNVHPAKTEVKFAQERQVFEAVYIACKNAIESADNMPQIKSTASYASAPKEDNISNAQQKIVQPAPPKTQEPIEQFLSRLPHEEKQLHAVCAASMKPEIHAKDDLSSLTETSWRGTSAAAMRSAPPVYSTTGQDSMEHDSKTMQPVKPILPPHEQQVPTVASRVIGECFHTYIIAEESDGITLIDKHAAHERIIFNRLRAESDMPQQTLLTPCVVELSATQSALLAENLDQLQKVGFATELFGENSFVVRAVPAYLDAADIPAVLSEIADKLSRGRAATPDGLDDLIHTVSCKAAIKAGKGSTIPELQSLCDRVLNDPDVRSCPHGRPVAVQLTKYELDKLFKRVNQ